ncbi:hypothetical protein NQ315_017308 [Exocentrus adspersus]|uniref:Uncharacterized protein n=1 Tax=Exocentrus adspersus TaxID=1586481 RepID=A0AAV8VK64_9CUCU|nr:hypothetical protein NQ315_017308 [Exocentrus adspersus]
MKEMKNSKNLKFAEKWQIRIIERSTPPVWMSRLGPNMLDAIAEHSMCHPGLPRPQGDSHDGSPGACLMTQAKYQQAQELRAYLKSLGAEISEEKSPKGIEDDLHKIIGVCDTCFKEGQESDVEMILNDIVSIMVLIPLERSENIILAFCEKLTKAQGAKLGQVCLRA